MLADVPVKMHTFFMPQTEQLGIREIPVDFGYSGVLDKPWGSGILEVIPMGSDLLITRHDLLLTETLELTEHPGECACVCTMSRACTRSIPQMRIDRPKANDNILGFAMSESQITFDISAMEPYTSCCLLMLPGIMDDIGDLYPGDYEQLCRDIYSIDPEAHTPRLTSLLKALSDADTTSVGARLGMRGMVLGIMAEIAISAAAKRQASLAEGTPSQRALVRRAKSLIESRLGSGMTIDSLASELYVGRSKLCSAFKMETGMGIGEFARKLRAERAKEMLLDGGLSVSEIAGLLGYSRQSSFYAMFRSETGMSPTQWREKDSGR